MELDRRQYALALARRRIAVRRAPSVVKRGTNNAAAIKGLQQRLAFYGLPINADGIFGPETEKAVRQFQKQQGIKVDGLVGPETLSALLTAQAPKANPADPGIDAIPAGPKGTGGSTSYKGGAGLGALQQAINGTGGTTGTQGTAGTGTRSRGAGSGRSRSTRGRGKTKRPAPGTPGTSATAKTGPIGSTQVKGPTGYTWDKGASGTDYTAGPAGAFNDLHPRVGAGQSGGGQFAVKSGDSGQLVTNTQTALNQAGGAKLKADGKFGPKTKAAVISFQGTNGLKQDGIVGPKTAKALRSRLTRAAQPFQQTAQGLQGI